MLAAWSGLGYYHRARNLLRGGPPRGGAPRRTLPEDAGGGPRRPRRRASTPRAPCSRSPTGSPCPSWTATCGACWPGSSPCAGRSGARTAPYYNLAEEILDRESPGDWNQALMELGATVCTPRTPACPACPLRTSCRALALGLVDELPEGRARRAPRGRDGGRRPHREQGTAAAPGAPRRRAGSWAACGRCPRPRSSRAACPTSRASCASGTVSRSSPGPLVVRARHAITFRRIRVEGYRARLRQPPPRDPDRYRWARPDGPGLAARVVHDPQAREGPARPPAAAGPGIDDEGSPQVGGAGRQSWAVSRSPSSPGPASTTWRPGKTPEYPDLRVQELRGEPGSGGQGRWSGRSRASPAGTVVGSGHGRGGHSLQAVHTTPSFGFEDEVTIRIRREGAKTRVTVRSRSRTGLSTSARTPATSASLQAALARELP